MIASWAVVLSALVYLCLLFAVAHWGDTSGRRVMRRRARRRSTRWRSAVYCTSWTFYGSVGLASRSGLDFLAIYIGPILVIGLGHPLVARVIRDRQGAEHHVGRRFRRRPLRQERAGRGARLPDRAGRGAIPYIALQLKAVSASLVVFLARAATATGGDAPGFGDLALSSRWCSPASPSPSAPATPTRPSTRTASSSRSRSNRSSSSWPSWSVGVFVDLRHVRRLPRTSSARARRARPRPARCSARPRSRRASSP